MATIHECAFSQCYQVLNVAKGYNIVLRNKMFRRALEQNVSQSIAFIPLTSLNHYKSISFTTSYV